MCAVLLWINCIIIEILAVFLCFFFRLTFLFIISIHAVRLISIKLAGCPTQINSGFIAGFWLQKTVAFHNGRRLKKITLHLQDVHSIARFSDSRPFGFFIIDLSSTFGKICYYLRHISLAPSTKGLNIQVISNYNLLYSQDCDILNLLHVHTVWDLAPELSDNLIIEDTNIKSLTHSFTNLDALS
ncbi:hypothetical protein ACJX0J_014587 [Zea mays]